jgi:hypothetical protein
LKKLVHIGILFLVYLNTYFVFSQKTLDALRVHSKVTIDGELSEEEWNTAKIASDFIQSSPNVGNPASQKTEVRILYDDFNIYIGAKCYDDMSKVSHVLSQRDDFNSNTDYFTFIVDTYNDDQNGFAFGVSSMGVQYDAKIFVADWYGELDMAWKSEVKLHEDNWTVEIVIPYSAFRFAKTEVQNWGVNFIRQISRKRESSSWNPIRPDFDNDMAQCGNLLEIKGIKPPFRLSLMPYVSSYAEHFPYNVEQKSNWGRAINGGMDIKYGINEAFTLDMTLIPDFGQVQFDNEVLNLSPFEIQFTDYRQFFTEGTELFNKTNLFYSRRIGGSPLLANSVYNELNENEKIDSNPRNTQLLNATKVSGRTSKGLGIGVFNGVSANTFARISDTITGSSRQVKTAPLSNYNVLVLDKNLKNNSYITFTNTNVWREGDFYDANLSALHTKLNTQNNKYFIASNLNVSQQYRIASNDIGHSLGFNIGKQTGKLTYQLEYNEDSDTYNQNDLGFLLMNNVRRIQTKVDYNIYKPFWKLNRLWSSLSIENTSLFSTKQYIGTTLEGNVGVTDTRFHSYNFELSSNLTESNDFFEPRAPGYFFIRPANINIGGWLSSNYQKRFALDASIFGNFFNRANWQEWTFRLSPRFRLSDRLFLILDHRQVYTYNEQGYALLNSSTNPLPDNITIGQRDKLTATNTINFNYTLTNRMGITFRLRHYWARVNYSSFFNLQNDGYLNPIAFQDVNEEGQSYYNLNNNAFTIDMVYRWVFAPASEINIVWKNSIFNTNNNATLDYFRNINELMELGALNSISIRFMYFFDTIYLKKLKKNRSTI